MFKKLALLAITAITIAGTAFAAPTLLAPVDPLSWAVANADWQGHGGKQIESLRKVVNGQVAAHQVSSSYTDPKTRVVKRVKCSDPANCMMCSQSARETAKKLRAQITSSASVSAGAESILGLRATLIQAQADAMEAQARWNNLKNTNTIIETATVDGETVSTSKTVTVQNGADAELMRQSQLLQQLAASTNSQAAQQGATVYTYINAAQKSLNTPQPATELYLGSDPLE